MSILREGRTGLYYLRWSLRDVMTRGVRVVKGGMF